MLYGPATDPESRYIATLGAQSSRTRMARALRTLARLHIGHRGARVDWAGLGRMDVLTLVRGLDDRALNTAKLLTSALRGVLREAGVPWEVWSAAKPPRGATAPAGVALSDSDRAVLTSAARTDRDRAMLAVLDLGLRIGEVSALAVPDVDHARALLLVRGKGRRQRLVACTPATLEALRQYVADRDVGPVFVTRSGAPMEVRTLQAAFATLVKRAGVACSPHDCRRATITMALARAVPIEAVATHVGHASIETTRRYARPDPVLQSRAVAQALARPVSR